MNTLSITEAAKLAGVSRNTMYSKIKKGILSKSKDSKGRVYIELSELLRVYPDAKKEQDKEDVKHDVQSEHLMTPSELQELVTLRAQVELYAQKEEMLNERVEFYKGEVERLRLTGPDKPIKQSLIARIFG